MVLLNMSMKTRPSTMRELFVMMITLISPSRREVSPAEQLRQSPRLVLPHGGGVSSRKLAYDFSSDERLHIAEDGHRRANRGAHEAGARPHPRGQGVGPLWYFLRSILFIISKMTSVEFQDFWSCVE